MTASSQQIVTAFDTLGMLPEAISEEFNFDLISVKATLMQFSSKYRELMKEEPSLNYDVDEQLEAKSAILSIMRNTEDEHLRAKLALKIRDDGKGRLDVVSNILNGGKIDINVFNIRLLEARAAKAKSKEISVESTVTTLSKQEVAA